jgi:integrase
MAQVIKRGDNRWQVMVFRGRDASGKKKFHIKTIKGPKKAALKYGREIETAITTGSYSEPTKQTLADFLGTWLDGTASQRLRKRTLASYRKLARSYLIPALGDRQLAQLRLPDIEAVYAQMSARGLSSRTVRYTHSVLRAALNHALRARLISHNPTDHATLPRLERKEMRFLTPAQVNAFLKAARDDRFYALWEILTLTGLRPGEALGLQWADVSERSIKVQRTLVEGGEHWSVDEPKTRRSRRVVPLAESTIRALQLHRKRQAEERLRVGQVYTGNDFIFASSTGLPLDIKNLTARHFRKVLSAAGVPRIRLYDLRHTAASLMLAADVNAKVTSERLGHSTIVLTMDTYSHVMPGMQVDAVAKVDRLLAAAGP